MWIVETKDFFQALQLGEAIPQGILSTRFIISVELQATFSAECIALPSDRLQSRLSRGQTGGIKARYAGCKYLNEASALHAELR